MYIRFKSKKQCYKVICMGKLFSIALFLSSLAGGFSPAMAATSGLTLIYSGNLNGELEPCGCTEEGNMGGIRRRATMINKLRSEQPNLFLISAGGLLSSESPRDRLKGEYILKGIATINYDAIGVQWRDLAFGPEFTNKVSIPWVASNWLGSDYPAKRTIKHGKHELAFFTWLDPRKSPKREMKGEHQEVKEDMGALIDAIAEAKKQGRITLLSTTYSLKKARKKIPLENIDILIIKAAHEEYGEPRLIGQTLVLEPGSRGMRLGKLVIELDSGNRIRTFQHEVIALPSKIPDAPNLADWYDEYNAKVKADYLKRVEIRKQMESGGSPFLGEEGCKNCHAKAYQIWQNSQHATAYEDLEAVNKAFDPDCIVCHTVGFEKKGGFIDSTVTAHLINVQCESCHGAGRAHAQSGGMKPVANAQWPKEKICAQCHIGSHSPSFNFEKYWPKIAHGKN
jgi:hypothetical protein